MKRLFLGFLVAVSLFLLGGVRHTHAAPASFERACWGGDIGQQNPNGGWLWWEGDWTVVLHQNPEDPQLLDPIWYGCTCEGDHPDGPCHWEWHY